MKKYLILASAALVALAACTKEKDYNAPALIEEGSILTFTSQRPLLTPDSKTAWDATTSSIVWQSTDKIKVGFTFDNEWWAQTAAYASTNESPNNHIKFYQSGDIAIDSESSNIATFTVPTNFAGPTTSGDFVFYAVYPAALVDNSLDTAPSATVTLKTTQGPSAGSFDASTDIMVGTSETITSTGLPSDPIELNWNRVVAHAALTFSDLAFNGTETPTKITLTFNEEAKVAGSFSVSIADGTSGTGSANEIVLEGSGLVVDGSSITTWATVLPVSFTSLNVEIKTDKATYTRSITGLSKTFKKNARNTLTIGMSTADREAATEYDWVKKDLTAITSSDVFVIVGDNGSNYAMSNGNGASSAPSAVAVTVANNKLSTAPGDNIQWNLSVDGSNYTFYPNGTTETWLYCTNNNNGLRVGTGSDKVFTITDDYLYNSGQSRYIGIYNSQDWRSYKLGTGNAFPSNIKDQTFAFYVRTASGSSTPANYAVTWTNPTENGCSISATVNSTDIASGDEFASGTVVTITATAGTDYTFDGWNVTGATAADASATTTTFTIGDSAVSFSATFNSTVVTPTALPYEETFASDQGDFTIDDVVLDGLSYVWSHDSGNGYMKATGYASSTNHDVESWLVSPLLEIPTISTGETVKLKFTQCINKYFGTVADEATLWVKEEGGSWTNVAITYPTLSGNWSSFEAQIVDLSSYTGKNIQFAFKYVGTSTTAGTWEIKDVSVKKYEPKALSSISVSGQTTIFTKDDAFAFGGTVTATYNDETTADVTASATFSGYNMSSTGEQTVTVSYTESGVTKTTTYTITVNSADTESVVYTLDGTTTGGSNGYADESEITQNNISWKVMGNTTMNPWRIGGKSLTSVDRTVYSTTALNKNISKIDITHGTAANVTVNSMTVIVSKNSDFSNPVSTLTPTFAASSTVTVNRPDGADWSNCYYKIVYNITISDTSNKFIQFTKAEFTGK